MITEEHVLPLLMEACPSFKTAWETELDEFDKENLYMSLGALAHHLLALYRGGCCGEFRAVAQVIERLHVDGDYAAREAAITGLIEGIQNIWGDEAEGFFPFLWRESAESWKALNRFWQGKEWRMGGTPPTRRHKRHPPQFE